MFHMRAFIFPFPCFDKEAYWQALLCDVYPTTNSQTRCMQFYINLLKLLEFPPLLKRPTSINRDYLSANQIRILFPVSRSFSSPFSVPRIYALLIHQFTGSRAVTCVDRADHSLADPSHQFDLYNGSRVAIWRQGTQCVRNSEPKCNPDSHWWYYGSACQNRIRYVQTYGSECEYGQITVLNSAYISELNVACIHKHTHTRACIQLRHARAAHGIPDKVAIFVSKLFSLFFP